MLQIGSRWSGFGRLSQRKIALHEVPGERQRGFTVGMAFQNSKTHVWRDLKGWRLGLKNLVVVIAYILKPKHAEGSFKSMLNSLWLSLWYFWTDIFQICSLFSWHAFFMWFQIVTIVIRILQSAEKQLHIWSNFCLSTTFLLVKLKWRLQNRLNCYWEKKSS